MKTASSQWHGAALSMFRPQVWPLMIVHLENVVLKIQYMCLFPITTVTNYHLCSTIKQYKFIAYSFVVQKSNTDLTGLKSRCGWAMFLPGSGSKQSSF